MTASQFLRRNVFLLAGLLLLLLLPVLAVGCGSDDTSRTHTTSTWLDVDHITVEGVHYRCIITPPGGLWCERLP